MSHSVRQTQWKFVRPKFVFPNLLRGFCLFCVRKVQQKRKKVLNCTSVTCLRKRNSQPWLGRFPRRGKWCLLQVHLDQFKVSRSRAEWTLENWIQWSADSMSFCEIHLFYLTIACYLIIVETTLDLKYPKTVPDFRSTVSSNFHVT